MPDLHNAYCYFLEDDKFLDTDRPGFRRRVVTGDHLQLCFWRITGGADRQRSCTTTSRTSSSASSMRGKLDFRIGDDPTIR